jgi:hypothetical protein
MLREAPEYKAPPPLRVTRRPAPPRKAPEVSSSSTAPPPVVVAPPPPKPDTAKVQIFRGSKVETKKFETDSAPRDSTARP